jgi:hypothetical protein
MGACTGTFRASLRPPGIGAGPRRQPLPYRPDRDEPRDLDRAPPKLAFFDCAGVRLLLDVPEDKEFDHPGSILYFAVDEGAGS